MSISLNKVCCIEDFSDPEFLRWLLDVFAHETRRFPSFPHRHEYRKHWEITMAAMTFGQYGILNDTSQVLGVGAGSEPTLFWLTNHVGRVFATDLYADADNWAEAGNQAMLSDPGKLWPFAWNPRRLVVQHMDALNLQYEDNSFDAVFSSGSIEHFGTLEDITRSIREIYRVLKPGGIASLSTEYTDYKGRSSLQGTWVFDRTEVEQVIFSEPWEQLDAMDYVVTDATLQGTVSLQQATDDVMRHLRHEGVLKLHTLRWSQYPMLVQQYGDLIWTSIHFALRKPDSSVSSGFNAPAISMPLAKSLPLQSKPTPALNPDPRLPKRGLRLRSE